MRHGGDNGPVQLITSRADWTLLVPLKSSVRGKSRIDVDSGLRGRLAFAMAADTVEAAAAAPGVGLVLVVAEDAADGDRLAHLPGVRVQLTTTTGLNEAILDGLTVPDGAVGDLVAVLPGDLPSLTADELGDALATARWHRNTVVADRQGTGTTMLTATERGRLRPHYGRDSLRRHMSDGAVLLDLPVESGLRRDVDQLCDLVGVSGPRTLTVLDAAGWGARLCDARPTC